MKQSGAVSMRSSVLQRRTLPTTSMKLRNFSIPRAEYSVILLFGRIGCPWDCNTYRSVAVLPVADRAQY